MRGAGARYGLGMLVMGLDEAGRGAVLGPLVVGAYWAPLDRLEAVRAAGATDSKRLSPARREALEAPLAALGGHAVVLVQAPQIDAGNLNRLEEDAFAALIRATRPDRVVIDAPCNPAAIPAFCRRLLAVLEHHPELVVEPKADLNHPICGAASIFAKLQRDRELAALGQSVGGEGLGSGYPSDPLTRRWLSAAMASGTPLPSFVRQRWGTLGALGQGSLF